MINTIFINDCIKSGVYNMVNISETGNCFVCTLEIKKPDPNSAEDDGQMSLPGMECENPSDTEQNTAAGESGADGQENADSQHE